MPEEAIDLIKRIFVIDPSKRLGAGSDSSEYSLSKLKSHAFFWWIDFNSIHKRSPPLLREWMSHVTHQMTKPDKQLHMKKQVSMSSNNSDDDLEIRDPPSPGLSKSQTIKSAKIYKWNRWYFY